MSKKQQTSIHPCGDKVLVKMSDSKDSERKLDSGIILPSSVKGEKDSTKRGEVIAIGPGKRDEGDTYPIEGIALGDTILFSWGDQLTVDGEEYYLVSESNILAVIK